MSESAKLRNLLNKTKPTIQFEVRRKKPTSIREFLEYVKELEDLYQLSNINRNEANISLTSTSTMIPSLVNNSNEVFPNQFRSQHWKRINDNYTVNYNKNNSHASYASPPSNSSFQPRRTFFRHRNRQQYPSLNKIMVHNDFVRINKSLQINILIITNNQIVDNTKIALLITIVH